MSHRLFCFFKVFIFLVACSAPLYAQTTTTLETQEARRTRLEKERFKMMENARKAKQKAYDRKIKLDELRKQFAARRTKATDEYQVELLKINRQEKAAVDQLMKSFEEEDKQAEAQPTN